MEVVELGAYLDLNLCFRAEGCSGRLCDFYQSLLHPFASGRLKTTDRTSQLL